jgi:hypothetical protein
MALTTPQRVRNRINQRVLDIGDDKIGEYIDESQAYMEERVGATWTDDGSAKFKLARGCCTDLAAVLSIQFVLFGRKMGLNYRMDELQIDKSDKQKSMLSQMFNIRMDAERKFKELEKYTDGLPMPSTFNPAGG